MINKRWLATCGALALAALMLWAEAGWAQGQGGGPPPQAGQRYLTGGSGRGANYQNCPNYPDPAYQNCPQGRANNQGRRGLRRGGQRTQSTPQTPAPAATQ